MRSSFLDQMAVGNVAVTRQHRLPQALNKAGKWCCIRYVVLILLAREDAKLL